MSAVGSVNQSSAVQQVLALRAEVLSRSEALQEVRAATGIASPTGSITPETPFADMLTGALEQVSAVQQRSGDMQVAYERGEVTDIAQVMLARQEAGVAFEATLQVRNKLLSAYQDIMRMGS